MRIFGFAFVSAFVLAAFLSFVVSWPVYMLWNECFVDAVSGVHKVTWLQAWGLSWLTSLLFKSAGSIK